MKLTICFISLSLLLTFSIGHAEKKGRFPVGCIHVEKPFNYRVLILKSASALHLQTLYFIHNIKPQKVYLTQAINQDKPYIMHINTWINGKRWAALATDETEIKFICSTNNKNKKYRSVVDCGKYLDICEFKQAKFATNNRGNYWAITNQSMKGAIRNLRYQGVWLRYYRQKAVKEIE